jgi:hypothetical protein
MARRLAVRGRPVSVFLFTELLLTNSIQLSLSWEAASRSATQCPNIVWSITMFTLVPTLSRMNSVHTTPSCFLTFILILSTHLQLCLPSGLFFWLYHQYPICTPLLSIRVTCPAHLILLHLIILIILGEEYKLKCSFLHPPVTSSLFGPNILLNTLFSNTLSLCSSLNVRVQVSHPYRTTCKTVFLYILIFTFLRSRQEGKRSRTTKVIIFYSSFIRFFKLMTTFLYSICFTCWNVYLTVGSKYRFRKPKLTAEGIRCAYLATPSIRKSWH